MRLLATTRGLNSLASGARPKNLRLVLFLPILLLLQSDRLKPPYRILRLEKHFAHGWKRLTAVIERKSKLI
jgi:hypothetical protein